MKRSLLPLVLALVACLAASAQPAGTGGSPSASPTTSPSATPQTGSPAKPAATPAPAPAPAATPAKPNLSKDETVFTVLDPSGTVKSIIVSDWIHSDKPNIEIKDKSNLTNIENVKGYEQPKRVGDSLMWKLDGNDLYYRGKSTQTLPLSVTIRYWLDGKPIEPKALAGKSGLVRIRVEVKNLATAERIIDGTKRKIYAPMVTVVGVILPVVGYREIQVPSGLMLTDGQSNIAAGILFPGLKESIVAAGGFGSQGIDLSSFGIKDLPLPDAFEFTAKVDRFKLGSIYIAATPYFPEIGGPNTVKTLDDALIGFTQLSDASKAIADGSAQLAQGTATLRAAVTEALTTLRPLLTDVGPALETITSLLNDDKSVAAARELFSAAGALAKAVPAIADIQAKADNDETRARIKSIVANAQKINVKDLVGIPGAASLLTEDSLNGIAEFVVAGDDLYKSMDEGRLRAAADFAANSTVLFDALSGYDDLLKSYDPAAGQAVAAFGAQAGAYDQAAKNAAKFQSFDAAKAASALQDRGRTDAAFLGATGFLDDSAAVAALGQKLTSGAALSDTDRAALAKLLSAATAERGAAAASSFQPTAEILPQLADAARLAAAAGPAAQASASVGRIVPGLAVAQANRTKNDAAIASARKILDPKMTSMITTTVPKVISFRKSFDRNKNTLQAARSFLAIRIKNGSFKAQIDTIDAIQKDFKALEPALTSIQNALASPELVNLLGLEGADSTAPGIADFIADFNQLQPLFKVGGDFLSSESVQKFRLMFTKMPDIDSTLKQFDDGSALLAVKMSELAAGTKKFDEQGIQMLSTEIVDKAQILRGFLKVKDELTVLSRDYQTFSGAPEGSSTSLKFIFKTDEIK